METTNQSHLRVGPFPLKRSTTQAETFGIFTSTPYVKNKEIPL